MSKNAKVIIVSSVSGGGKTTIINHLRIAYPEISLAITATTRPPRGKEQDGKDYYFYTNEEFSKQIQTDHFIEYAKVHGYYYGVPAGPVWQKLEGGSSIILNIDTQGMQTMREKLDRQKMISFFLMPPNLEIWRERLCQRKTNTEQQIKERMARGQFEIEQACHYDHIITNDTIENTLEKIVSILKQIKILS